MRKGKTDTINFSFLLPSARKNNLTLRVYSRLLERGKTVTELSKELYNGKKQTAQISHSIKFLKQRGYVMNFHKTILQQMQEDVSLRKQLLIATPKPFVEYTVMAMQNKGKGLSEEEKIILNVILSSKWFRSFCTTEYLTRQKGGFEQLHTSPLEFFANTFSEICLIRALLTKIPYEGIDVKQVNSTTSFDNLIETSSKPDSELRSYLDLLFTIVKILCFKSPSIWARLDKYKENFAFLHIPYALAQKLSGNGQPSRAVQSAFSIAISATPKTQFE